MQDLLQARQLQLLDGIVLAYVMQAKNLPLNALKLAELELRKHPDIDHVIIRTPQGDLGISVLELYSELARRMNGFVN